MTKIKLDPGLIARIDGSRFSLSEGGVVFLKGDTGDSAYVVAKGLVEIREGGRVIETIDVGELFGELAMIDSEPRSASAVAIGPTELIPIERSVFERMLETEPGFALTVLRLMSRRLRAMLVAPRLVPEELPIAPQRPSPPPL